MDERVCYSESNKLNSEITTELLIVNRKLHTGKEKCEFVILCATIVWLCNKSTESIVGALIFCEAILW